MLKTKFLPQWSMHILKTSLSYDVAEIQWMILCHKNHMSTCVITLWLIHETSLTTYVSTIHFYGDNVHFKGDKIPFQRGIL